MKKLMFAAAAIAAGVAVADVTSANIVGYAGVKTDNDWGTKFLTAQFGNCGDTKKIKLADITPVATGVLSKDDLIGNVSFQIIDNAGYTVDGSARTWDGAKWVSNAGDDMSAELYDVGTGFSVANFAFEPEGFNTDYVNFQSAGQVVEEDVLFKLDNDWGTIAVGNPFPTALKLSDMIPFTDEKNYDETPVDLAGNISFQYIDNAGYTVVGSARTWDGAKWVTNAGEDASNETIIPGDGISVGNIAMRVMDEQWSEILCANVTLRLVAPVIK